MSGNASSVGGSALLPADLLKRLATSESGFIFDPASGDSFTANASALAIIRLATTESSPARIAELLAEEFDVSRVQAEREVVEFASVLRQALG
ncbi:MAG: PqqD family protein [Reyranella sp.]|uniref:PqqD family protein n=1 Tax=Reyranella sp. TaxID=1929291 RepID=UPI0011FE9313|nr:PqqD family protein [Reyranella sp.]TAJ38684.1 MAG: PqqD family protein [Reyranella sp.]